MSDPKSGDNHPHKPKLNPGDEADPDTPGAGENICRECQGTGKIGEKECPICGGTGIVIEENRWDWTQNSASDQTGTRPGRASCF